MRHTGRPLPRIEDEPLLTGRGGFVGDRRFAGELHMRVVRSPVAFGPLRAVDTSAARAVPGVAAVWTAGDVALPAIPLRSGLADGLDAFRQPVLATALVRYVGEPVAAVFAETAAAAEDGADLVGLDIDAARPVVDAAARPRRVADDRRSPDAAVVVKAVGDVDAVFRASARVVERRVSLARDGAMPIEPRGIVACWDGRHGILEVFGATGALHAGRDALAAALDLPRSAVVLVRTAGSGADGEVGPEHVLAAHAARALGRPVRWTEDRREHTLAADQTGGISAHARAAVADDGTILAIDADLVLDQGAYIRPGGIDHADLVAALVPGSCRVAASRVTLRVRMTNRTPAGSGRGSAAAVAAFVRERLLDGVADALGLDPLEVRRRNVAALAAAPVPRGVTALGVPVALDGGRHRHLLDAAARRFALDTLRRQAEERRAAGELVGVGAAFSIDLTGVGPPERVRLSVDRRGTVEMLTSAAGSGEGLETMLAQIVADIVGVDLGAIRFAPARTDRLEGAVGTALSGGMVMTGTAVLHAAEALREKILDAASRLLGVPAERLMIEGGRVRDAERHLGPQVGIGDLARALEPGGPLAAPDGCGLAADGWHRPDGFAVPYALTIATVEIDAMTGIVRVPRAMIAAEVGNAINPQIVEERLAGGLLAGLASALHTSLSVFVAGMPVVNGFADYAMPGAGEAPAVEVLVTEDAPSPLNPLGLMDVDGLGTGGIGAAVAAAVDDALGAPGFASSLPIAPARVREHIVQRLDARAERRADRIHA